MSTAAIFNPTRSTQAASGQGFAFPRMTTADRLAIVFGPGDAGMCVYDTSYKAIFQWDGTQWNRIGTLPVNATRKMVIIGSSVAAGVGATTYANSYAGIWTVQLNAQGVSVVNKAVSGTNTVYWLANFESLCANETPDIVYIGLGLWNEGLGGAAVGAAKDAIYNQFVTNIAKLSTMAREIGARVIVGGNYCNNNWTSVDYQYVKQSYNDFTEMGLQVVQFLGTCDNGSGSWRTGMFADALHPNDNGHAAMAGALASGLFSRHEDSVVPSRYLATQATGRGIDMGNSVTNPMMLLTVDPMPYSSFTIGWRMRKQSGPSGVVVPLCFADTTRLRNPVSEWRFTSLGSDIITTTVTPDFLWHHYALGFDYFTNQAWLWIDGVLVGSSAAGACASLNNEMDTVSLMGRFDNLGFNVVGGISDVTLHRYRLRTDEVLALANGNIPTSSLDLCCGFADPVDTLQQYGRPGNAGFGNSYLEIFSEVANTQVTDAPQAGNRQMLGQLVVTGNGTANPGYPKAALAIPSTTRGFQLPSMTTAQRDLILPGATDFIMIYNTSTNQVQQWTGAAWANLN